MTLQKTIMDIHTIRNYLPHRYPFLLIDKVIKFEKGKTLTAVKNVSVNEPQFVGHFPMKPVMPGVLIIEALAQATGVLAFKSGVVANEEHIIYMLAGIDKAKFKRVVEPGDTIILEVKLLTNKLRFWKFDTKAYVDDELVASAEIMCTYGSSA